MKMTASRKNCLLPILTPKTTGLAMVRPRVPPVIFMRLKRASMTKLMPMVVMARKSAWSRREMTPRIAPKAPETSMPAARARKKLPPWVVMMAAV